MEAVSGFEDPDDPEEPPEELGVDVPEDTEAAGSSLSTFTGQVLSNFMANQMQNQLPTSLGERTLKLLYVDTLI